MDQQRALVAVLLIFALLFGYNYYSSRQARERAAELEAAGGDALTENVVEATAGGEAPRSEEQAALVSEEVSEPEESVVDLASTETTGGTGNEFVIESPLWRATLSSRGGVVTSWQLKEYADAEGAPVELVMPGRGALSVDVGYGPARAATGTWLFASSDTVDIVLHEGDGSRTVVFEAQGPEGIRVVKRYEFSAAGYVFGLSLDVSGLDEPAAERTVWLGWPGVPPTEIREEDRSLASAAMIDGKVARTHGGSLKKEVEKKEIGEVGWVTSQSKYFLAGVIADGDVFAERVATRDEETRAVGFTAGAPVETSRFEGTFRVFAGPQDYILVSGLGVDLERAVDLGWTWTRPLSVVMLRALVAVHRVIPNYGLVIIVFSVLTKLLFYRLTHKSFTEMKRMQELQPKLEALKQKHTDDKEALSKASMELYKKEGVNPLGSCLPMILQMPVFIALFQVLRTTIELRGAPFILWISDLSQPETIAQIAGFPIHVLPVLMGVTMLIQQRMTTKDPSQAAMGKIMPIFMTVLFYKFASGLVLYWLVNSVLSVVQQYYIHRGPSPAAVAAAGAAAPEDVRELPTASVTTTPEFDSTASSTGEPGRSDSSRKRGKKRGRRRKK